MSFVKNIDKMKNYGEKLFKNSLAGLALSLSLVSSQANAFGVYIPVEVKPYFMENGDVKLNAIYKDYSFDTKNTLIDLSKSDNRDIQLKTALIEKILGDVVKFEKEYDISKIDYPNTKNLEEQLNVVFNSNLKELVGEKELIYSKLYLDILNKKDINQDKKEYDTPDGKQSLNDIMLISQEEMFKLVDKYNDKVINVNDNVANVTYGYTEENVGKEDFGNYTPKKETVEKVEQLIVNGDFDKTLESIINAADKIQLFTPNDLNKMKDYLELKESLNFIKNLPNIDSTKVDILENELIELRDSLNKDISEEFKTMYNIDLNKEIYKDNFSFREI